MRAKSEQDFIRSKKEAKKRNVAEVEPLMDTENPYSVLQPEEKVEI